MGRTHRHQGILLATVVLLATLAWWQWHSDHAASTLLPLDPASITRITISWQDRPARHYLKRDGHWYRIGKQQRRVDDIRLQHLAALAATPVLEWRKAASMDPGHIGLTTPPVRVRLDDHTLEWGSLTAFGPQRFVRVGKRIAVVPASYSPRAPSRRTESDATSDSSQKS